MVGRSRRGVRRCRAFRLRRVRPELLTSLIQKHGEVRLKAFVNARYYADTYPYVTAVLPGTNAGPRREEVLVLGHSAEQGAHDNATGVAAMVEALAALNRLIAAGKLARPVRSIRILAMGELYASMHYVQQTGANPANGGGILCRYASGILRSGRDRVHVLSEPACCTLLYRRAGTATRRRGAESTASVPLASVHVGHRTFLADPMIGVPTVWPYSGTGVNTHHNSEDKPDTVDPRSLRDLTVITAAYLYAIASAGPAEGLRFAEYAAERGKAQLISTTARQVERIAMASPDRYPALLRAAFDAIDYQRDREIQAVESVARLGVPNDKLGGMIEPLRTFTESQKSRLLQFAQARSPQVTPAAPPAGNPESSRVVVRRKRFGTLPLDELRPDQRQGFPSGAWDTRLITALYWCDGKRSLAEVIRLTELELGPGKVDLNSYFRFLAKNGYVDLIDR